MYKYTRVYFAFYAVGVFVGYLSDNSLILCLCSVCSFVCFRSCVCVLSFFCVFVVFLSFCLHVHFVSFFTE